MNCLNTAEIEDVIHDQGYSRTRLVLGLAWKTSVLLLGLAIVLGMSVGPSQPIDVASPGQPQFVKREGSQNCYQVLAKNRVDQANYAVELLNPNREKSAYVEYWKNAVKLSYIKVSDHFRIGTSNLQNNYPSAYIGTRTARTIVNTQSDGSVIIQVISEIGSQDTLAELCISPEGKVVPTHRSGF